ncbi:unnamed protein product (macronuclear) [Paramecium tetraurelia]|uniref:Transmembrane protein n=1 Tax=Paramecium tetraurelia TaxID=5888 RepID=A0C1W8_PARTE|nr:uncharacterized protein GSPATT00034262001 [Paramecium tetraurelia]CAK64785.1 unnamed protein product [Paramecium tetraurelia]|eukprot:XP_001432182.1 hypothetical protein (macronuclear) [Paramecium tetraurelia strain d4-2]
MFIKHNSLHDRFQGNYQQQLILIRISQTETYSDISGLLSHLFSNCPWRPICTLKGETTELRFKVLTKFYRNQCHSLNLLLIRNRSLLSQQLQLMSIHYCTSQYHQLFLYICLWQY